MRIKVIGGTPSGEPLCPSCKHSFRRRNIKGTDQTLCRAAPYPHNVVGEAIIECSSYHDKKQDQFLGTAYEIGLCDQGHVIVENPRGRIIRHDGEEILNSEDIGAVLNHQLNSKVEMN